MSSTNTSHFLFFTFPAWGHIRPFCVLAPRLVREQENVVVTFMVAPDALEKTRAEVSRQFLGESSGSAEALQRIRILSPTLSFNPDLFEMMKVLADAYPAAYQTLYDAKPITCPVTGTTFDAVPAPCAAVLDLFALSELRATRAISGHSVPVIACIAAGAVAMIHPFGPESMGGVGDIGARIDAETARTGLPDNVIGPKIYNHTEGKLFRVPGVPAMYDYEFFPQKYPFSDKPVHNQMRRGYGFSRECDAAIINTSYAYESVPLNAMKQWFSDMKKEIYVLGPLLPSGYGIQAETRNAEEGTSVDIETFLREMLVQHGKGSVFFISFGTTFYPSVSEYVDELIEALIEKKAPFIFAHASPFAKISEQLIEKVKSSGLGKLTTWSPQQFILNHPATGWFITHGGFNSVTESLGSGVPLICWPITADQPGNAAYVTEINVAFELFQVRIGDGLKPLARNGVAAEGTREAVGIEIRHTIDLCRSEKGQEMRCNAEQLKVKFAQTWEEDGIARQDIRKFLLKYT